MCFVDVELKVVHMAAPLQCVYRCDQGLMTSNGCAGPKSSWLHVLMHLLVLAGRDDFVKERWHGFLKSLEAQFLTSKKLDRMSDLKLLFTALLNFTPVDQI